MANKKSKSAESPEIGVVRILSRFEANQPDHRDVGLVALHKRTVALLKGVGQKLPPKAFYPLSDANEDFLKACRAFRQAEDLPAVEEAAAKLNVAIDDLLAQMRTSTAAGTPRWWRAPRRGRGRATRPRRASLVADAAHAGRG